jgi:surface carbohydrate biosynthesis protein (TIGR04326 family)
MKYLPEQQISLWDCDDPADPNIGYYYSWNGYSEDGSRRSLLRYVDTHGERLRAKYSAIIFDLGQSKINGKSIIDHLFIKKGFSYWWMTLLVEKSIWKSPSITDAIRLLALEELIIEQNPEHFVLYSSDDRIHRAIGALCHTLGVSYERSKLNVRHKSSLSFRKTYTSLPRPVRGLVYLSWYISTRWRFMVGKKSNVFHHIRSVFFCSYFDNLDKSAIQGDHFGSNYWGKLGTLLTQLSISQNWLHHYIPHRTVPTQHAAIEFIRRFSQNSGSKESHTFLESYLSLSVVLRVIINWCRLSIISWRLRNIANICVANSSRPYLWPILSDDWHSSMRGAVSIDNLFMLELFDKAMGDLPTQKQGFYLCENQAWERAFVHCWYKHKHGQLIAVPHSTRSFWDLRFHCDERLFKNSVTSNPQLPDFYAVNGLTAKNHFLSENYPGNVILECEALRYRYLASVPIRQRDSILKREDALTVLVLGDYSASTTSKILQMLKNLPSYISAPTNFHFKPHPGCPINPKDIFNQNVTVIYENLESIITNYDVIFSGNTTSAAVEAYVSGLPLAIMLDGSNLNVSPLRGEDGIRFVSSTEELAIALQENCTPSSDGLSFFYLDSDYPRWRKILLTHAANGLTA